MMKIRTTSAGVLDNFSDTTVVDKKKSWTVARFLDFIENKLKNDLAATIYSNHELRADISILLNGRSIRLYPAGLNTVLKDGDTIFICIVIAGG